MKIDIEHWPENYNEMIYTAGRNCYGTVDAGKNATEKQMGGFTRMLVGRGHESVLEHICVSVYAKDVSRSFLAQITRHRLVSYSVKSQHYVKHTNFKYKELENYGNKNLPLMQRMYHDLMDTINGIYGDMLKHGIPHYIAREILPNACLTDIYMTTNAREWRHIIRMRIGRENTPEIREFAQTVLRELYVRMPTIFEDLRDEHLEASE